MTNLTSVAIPVPLLKRARELGVNVSKTSREAVAEAVKKAEYTESQTSPAKNGSELSAAEAHLGEPA